jgi:hypothetical protein
MSNVITLLLLLACLMLLVASPAVVFAKSDSKGSDSGFVANPSNIPGKNSTGIMDPNYKVYQNLGLGFNMKYLKNMTVSEKRDNSSAFRTARSVDFSVSVGNSKIPLLAAGVLVTQATGMLGIPIGLDDVASQVMLAAVDSGNTTVVSKVKGSLNGLPAYRIEAVMPSNPVNYTHTTTKIPLHSILYLTIKGGLIYTIFFHTFDKNIQTDFMPKVKTMIGSFQYN